MLFLSLPPSLSPQFPECDDKKAISVSCLDLTYSISFRSHQVKDEKKDLTVAVVLNDLTEEEGSSDKVVKERVWLGGLAGVYCTEEFYY